MNLERIIIPKETKKIGSLAFLGCVNLKEIVIQDGADHIEIGRDAFSVCSNLERITIPESMTDIEGFSFDTSWEIKGNPWAGADIGKALSGGGYGFSI